MSVQVLAASQLPHEERAALWTEAFSDYFAPGVISVDTLKAMENMFDLDRDGSRLVIEDGRPVAFAMLGVRGPARHGPQEARSAEPGGRGWVGGMGVIPAARRRGHGDRVMQALMDAARERGLTTVRLEVLVQNAPAIPLYERLGFRTLRQLEVWERAADAPALPEPGVPAREVPLDEAVALLGPRRLDDLPWQRELPAARRTFSDLGALEAEADGARAVAIHRSLPERQGLLAIGVEPESGAAAGRALDRLLASLFAGPGRPARLVNLPANDPAAGALERAGAKVTHRQWEMEVAI